MERSVRILHKYNRRFCYFQEQLYICIELFDEMQSAAVQRSYMVAKSLPTTFSISTPRCHSDRYIKVSYPVQRQQKKSYYAIRISFLHFIHFLANCFLFNHTNNITPINNRAIAAYAILSVKCKLCGSNHISIVCLPAGTFIARRI